jgi:hypothetical protein
MPDVARTQVLRVGRQGEEGVDLALDEKLLRGRERAGHALDVLDGIEPDIGGHAGDQRLWHQSGAHLLTLQISDAADAFVRKQRIASDMHSGEYRRRRTGLDRRNQGRRIDHREIKLAAFHGLGTGALGCYRYMLNIREAFGAQQFIGDVCRRVANESAGRDANRAGFRRRLLGKALVAAEETCRTGQRRAGQKVATTVERLHHGSPYKS